MHRSFITVTRAEALTRTFGTAIELATVHLQAAVHAHESVGDRARLVGRARHELAHAVEVLDARRQLLEPLTASERLSEQKLLRSIEGLRALADELHAPAP